MSVHLTAPCRLHFGLFRVPDGERANDTDWQYGGLGLMIEQPAVSVTVSRSNRPAVAGSLGPRAAAFWHQIRERLADKRIDAALDIRADGPPEHVGLGVGTALGLAMAAACPRALGLPVPGTPGELAAWVGRGRRSGIGLHGFHTGGFLVDRGRLGSALPEVAERIAFPDGWRIVLVRPRESPRWHGEQERSAFQRPRTPIASARSAERLRSLSQDRIAPALRAQDFDGFCQSLAEFNILAGEPFREDQGGVYAGPAVTRVVEQLRGWGHIGVGQSSWGPTVFCILPGEDAASDLMSRARTAFPFEVETQVTRGDNRGYRLSEEGAEQADQ